MIAYQCQMEVTNRLHRSYPQTIRVLPPTPGSHHGGPDLGEGGVTTAHMCMDTIYIQGVLAQGPQVRGVV